MKEKIKKLRRKGFTLIELIVVIAILGILVLLAAPKFLGYTAEAKLTQAKADIKTLENSITAKVTKDQDYTSSWNEITKPELEQKNQEDKLLDKKGDLPDDYEFDGEYLEVPKKELDEIKTDLDGTFFWDNEKGKVIYEDESGNLKDDNETENGDSGDLTPPGDNGNQPQEPEEPELTGPTDSDGDGFLDSEDSEPNNPEVSGKDTDGDGLDDAYENTVSKTDPTKKDTDGDGFDDKTEIEDGTDPNDSTSKVYILQDTDFTWSVYESGVNSYSMPKETGKGYYKVNRTDLPSNVVIKVPETIKGQAVTSYAYMFSSLSAKKNTPSEKLKVISDNPNIKNTAYAFAYSKYKEIDVSDFNTSSVTSMEHMFGGSTTAYLNKLNMSNLDTSKVTNMKYMFYTTNAPLDLSSFNTSNVTDMSYMFANTDSATKIDLSSFDTSKVTNMLSMFEKSKATEIDLSSFNTSNVTTMQSMFSGTTNLTRLDLSNFNTSSVTNMSYMFTQSKATEIDSSSFDTSNVTTMQAMFKETTNFKGTLDLSNFRTSNVTDMDSMFTRTGASGINLSSFDTSKVTRVENMFAGLNLSEELDVSHFSIAKMESLYSMFPSSTFKELKLFSMNRNISLNHMFSGITIDTLDLSMFSNLSSPIVTNMFAGAKINTAYARNSTQAAILNGSSQKPTTFTFVVKP